MPKKTHNKTGGGCGQQVDTSRYTHACSSSNQMPLDSLFAKHFASSQSGGSKLNKKRKSSSKKETKVTPLFNGGSRNKRKRTKGGGKSKRTNLKKRLNKSKRTNRNKHSGGGFKSKRTNRNKHSGGGFKSKRTNRNKHSGGGFKSKRTNRNKHSGGGFSILPDVNIGNRAEIRGYSDCCPPVVTKSGVMYSNNHQPLCGQKGGNRKIKKGKKRYQKKGGGVTGMSGVDSNFSADMTTREFGCKQPFWQPNCT